MSAPDATLWRLRALHGVYDRALLKAAARLQRVRAVLYPDDTRTAAEELAELLAEAQAELKRPGCSTAGWRCSAMRSWLSCGSGWLAPGSTTRLSGTR